MTARRVADIKLDLPPNPAWIDFSESDGDPSTWPTNTTRIVDAEGHVNYMQELDLLSYSAIKWRTGVAKAISIAAGMPEGPNYVLRDWPNGYRMYDHHKGPVANPRHDIYLFGSSKKFRSINEFIPHAIWLYRDYRKTHKSCECKYCAKKTQKEVTSTLPIFRSMPVSASPVPSTSKPRVARDKNVNLHANRERQRDQKIYAVAHKTLKPVNEYQSLKPSSHILKQPMLAERNADIRAVTGSTSMTLKRWYREGELVFCAINPPIVGPTQDAIIFLWPGIVEETKLKTMPVPRDNEITTDSTSYSTGHHTFNKETPSGVVLEDVNSYEPLWAVRQHSMYKIQLLALSHSLIVPDDEVLPYLAYSMPPVLVQALSAQGLDNLDRESIKQFNPKPENGPSPTFAEAAAPFVVAMHIGVELGKFFSLLDDYKFKYAVPRSSAPQVPPPGEITTLQSAIEAAGRLNAQTGQASTSNSVDVDATGTLEEQSMERYQGLWWGPERIWADDMVRLKPSRIGIAPEGTEGIYPPSGPGPSSLQHLKATGGDPTKHGAGTRGVFLRVTSFSKVEAMDGNAIQQEVRMTGMLYELADEDWQECEQQTNVQSSAGSALVTTPPPSASYMPGPSPLKPPPLPNFDPSVPISSSASSILPQSSSTDPLQPKSSSQYFLPEPPRGYRFRQIMPDDHEIDISLTLLSGRYYPRIFDHPLLGKSRVIEKGDPNYQFALEGLIAGYYNSVDAQYHRTSRVRMMDDADKNAMVMLEEFFNQPAQLEDSIMEDSTEHAPALSNSMNVDV